MAEDGTSSQQLQFLLSQMPYKQLVRPNMINNLKSLGNEKKAGLIAGTNSLWNVISSRPPEDPSHKQAVDKLQTLTRSVMESEQKLREQQRLQSSQQPSQAQQQPAQPPQQQPSQQQQPQVGVNCPPSQGQTLPNNQTNAQTGQEVPEKYRRQAESIQWLAPSPQVDSKYSQELCKRYAEQLFKHELHATNVQRLEQQAQLLRTRNQEIPPDLIAQRTDQLSKQSAAKQFVERVNNQQRELRQQQSQRAAQNANGGAANPSSSQPQQTMSQHNNQVNNQMNPNVRPLPQNAQQQVNRPSTSGSHAHAPPSAGISTGQVNPPQTPQLHQQPQQQANFVTPRQQPPSGPGSFGNSPQTSMPPSATQPQQHGPVPYSHQGAIDAAAKSYNNSMPPQQQGAPGQFTGTGQTFNRADLEKSNSRQKNWPISKDFKPGAPAPVQMAPSRPTMAGSNGGPVGPMGQPAIQQPPKYDLHGPGDRVLSKKKLDELVRQVCGGGGESSGAQGLHPEVEESVLQLADEFFDNVVSAACKLAKLRGSNTLEIKDIQLVLQKTYNIRIPGYSTDEVRTVRRVQPTASYLQKMNAVQAAKMTKTDI